jgi:hypothetical protein
MKIKQKGYYGIPIKNYIRTVKFKKKGIPPKLNKAGKIQVYSKTLSYNPKTKKGKVRYQLVNKKDYQMYNLGKFV